MFVGTLFALVAGLMWGLVFVGPLILADYPAVMLTFGRYLAFGLVAVPLALMSRRDLRTLSRADWREAARLSLVGNIVYYLFLSSALQRAGGPMPTMIIGTLPVVIAVCANLRNGERDGHLPWRKLWPALVVILGGIALVNQAEMQRMHAQGGLDLGRYVLGSVLALGAVVCWTWYPLRNADWLRAHADRSPLTWATAQGLVTLPMAALGYGVAWLVFDLQQPQWPMPLGPRPLLFAGLMLTLGLLASWVGTLCWNEASQRLPTALTGPLIVFETLSALSYAFAQRGEWPSHATLLGITLLVIGVIAALRVRPQPVQQALKPPSTPVHRVSTDTTPTSAVSQAE
jgi:drug/metabolite transporter (DMT)-like permease